MSKQLEQAETEYLALMQRIKQVTDPKYLEELSERSLSLSLRIKKICKNKKCLEVEQEHMGKFLAKTNEKGEADISVEMNNLKAELSLLEAKEKEANGKLEKNISLIKEKSSKGVEWKESWKELSVEATNIGIDSSVVNNIVPEKSEISKRSEELEKKKMTILKTMQRTKGQYTVSINEHNEIKARLQEELNTLAQNLLRKNQ